MDPLTTESFREKMSVDIKQFSTRKEFDQKTWDWLCSRLYYMQGKFDDNAAFARLAELVSKLDEQYQAGGNVLFYMATPPSVFGLISRQPREGRLQHLFRRAGSELSWKNRSAPICRRAIALNREILKYWTEDQIYRIDHYLGKETVQNIIAFRFSNGMFEPLWNRNFIDHIQFSVAESVGVEGRGGYYDRSGVLRDMLQNHMFQMLAYLCMEPPASFAPEAVRNEKSKVLEAVRIMDAAGRARQHGSRPVRPGPGPDGKPALGYREEPSVPASPEPKRSRR